MTVLRERMRHELPADGTNPKAEGSQSCCGQAGPPRRENAALPRPPGSLRQGPSVPAGSDVKLWQPEPKGAPTSPPPRRGPAAPLKFPKQALLSEEVVRPHLSAPAFLLGLCAALSGPAQPAHPLCWGWLGTPSTPSICSLVGHIQRCSQGRA